MALSRKEVFDIIDAERKYQDSLWPPHDGHKNSEHALVGLACYLRKAEDTWLGSFDGVATCQQMAKMAAIIVRALESIPEAVECQKGLR